MRISFWFSPFLSHSATPRGEGYSKASLWCWLWFLMDYCWLRILRQVFPAQQPDRLGMLFMDVFYGRYTILKVPVDAPGRIPSNHLQLPEFLPQVDLSPVR